MDSVEKSFSLFMAYVEKLHFFSASFNGLGSVENIFSWFVVAHCAWETNPFFKVNWGCFFFSIVCHFCWKVDFSRCKFQFFVQSELIYFSIGRLFKKR